jgi:hypothetical protein
MSAAGGSENDPRDLVPVRDGAGFVLALPEVEARALQSLLQSCGITAVLSPFTAYTFMPGRLLVPASQVEEAARIIAEAPGAGCAEEAERAGEAAGDQPPEDFGKGLPGVF